MAAAGDARQLGPGGPFVVVGRRRERPDLDAEAEQLVASRRPRVPGRAPARRPRTTAGSRTPARARRAPRGARAPRTTPGRPRSGPFRRRTESEARSTRSAPPRLRGRARRRSNRGSARSPSRRRSRRRDRRPGIRSSRSRQHMRRGRQRPPRPLRFPPPRGSQPRLRTSPDGPQRSPRSWLLLPYSATAASAARVLPSRRAGTAD